MNNKVLLVYMSAWFDIRKYLQMQSRGGESSADYRY